MKGLGSGLKRLSTLDSGFKGWGLGEVYCKVFGGSLGAFMSAMRLAPPEDLGDLGQAVGADVGAGLGDADLGCFRARVEA